MDYKKGLVGFLGVGAALPALALFAGYPQPVCDGLGRPYESWILSKEAKFGLYLYSVSDIVLGMVCGASFVENSGVSTSLALAATAAHQAMYLAASIPSMGFRKEHIASIVAGSIAAAVAIYS